MAETEELKFFEKVLKVQQAFSAPKNLHNDFGKYAYRNAEKMMSTLKPLLEEHGLYVITFTEPVICGEYQYIKVTAKITDGENELESSSYAREQEAKKGMDAAQITGAAESYAKKYALGGLLGVDDSSNDPDGKDNAKDGDSTSVAKKKAPAAPAADKAKSPTDW